MRTFLTVAATAVPAGAWAHGPDPVGHAHPHGLEFALILFVVVVAATLSPAALRALRARRERRK
jgi:hypothetical protein